MTTDLATALASPDILARIDTVATIVQDPSGSRPALASITIDPKTQLVARLWAMIAISQIGDDEHGLAATALIQNLSAPEPIIRRCAIETLGLLKVTSAAAQIAHHLGDGAAIPEAWFNDTSTPAQAAHRALESIGTPEAWEALRCRFPIIDDRRPTSR
jgi:HEAT repeat protein